MNATTGMNLKELWRFSGIYRTVSRETIEEYIEIPDALHVCAERFLQLYENIEINIREYKHIVRKGKENEN